MPEKLNESTVSVLYNIAIVFLLSGLWHGAKWTFIAWGLLHSFYLIVENLKKRILKNPVSILYPDYNGWKYNPLITRLQNSPALQMQIIDIYSTSKNSNLQVYERSDSHWNRDGAFIWLNQFNTILINHTKSNFPKASKANE